MKNKNELKNIVKSALESEYGFAPTLSKIVLLEADGNGTYIRFKVNGKEYSFDSYDTGFGIWVGTGTITKM